MRSPSRARATALIALAAGVVALVATPAQGSSVTGKAGLNTALPATDSKVTVSGRGAFSDLKVTVNQTKNLINQAVSVTWTGGRPTKDGPGRFGRNYLQMMQCWGDDDGTNEANPGPPPQQCVAGATNAVFGGRSGGLFPGGSFATERILSRDDWENYDPEVGAEDAKTGYVWMPFRSVSGRTTGVHVNSKFNPTAGGEDCAAEPFPCDFWLNPLFNVITTNEISAARTGPNGTGAELFEVNTGIESSGLGCGQKSQPTASGPKTPKCWLVVVPRGTPAEENVGTPYGDSPDQWGVMTSPLAATAWQNRIAIPLEFAPVETTCSLDSDQRRIVGSELLTPAVSSWQPKLCGNADLSPYSFASVPDASARGQIVSPAQGSPGMAVVSRPIAADQLDPESPVVYAPLTLSGVVIGLNVERNPKSDADAEAQALAGIRVADLNLTPRLVAKLLTQSYATQVRIKGSDPGYEWAKDNPAHLGADPDFLAFNPEFKELQIASGKNFGGLLLPPGNSDVARLVWEYVLADSEARAWLDGEPDESGMKVNPVYSGFVDAPPESFPKGDPYCFEAEPQGADGTVQPPLLCGTDWLPYVLSLREAARLTRAADDGAKVVEDPFAQRPEQVYKRDLPQQVGSRIMLAVTDTASAFQYGVQMARLSRAGDTRGDRSFIAPTAAALVAGVDGMAPGAEPAVLEPKLDAKADAGYPLASLTYAAIKPLALDEKARKEYAAFVSYAAGAGQVPGQGDGKLPGGYAPLPAALQTQAANAAKKIVDLTLPVVAGAADVPRATEGGDGGVPTSFDSGGFSAGSSSFDVTTPFLATGDTPIRTAPRVADRATKRLVTPGVPVAVTRFAMPTLFVLALLAAIGAIGISKRPRSEPS